MSERSAQTLAMLVRVADRVPVLGRVPSGMRQAAWDEWLQGWHSPRRRRRSTWRLCHLAVCPCYGCVWRLHPSLKCGWHSATCAECHPHLSGDAPWHGRPQQGSTVRDACFQRFHRGLTDIHMQQAISRFVVGPNLRKIGAGRIFVSHRTYKITKNSPIKRLKSLELDPVRL